MLQVVALILSLVAYSQFVRPAAALANDSSSHLPVFGAVPECRSPEHGLTHSHISVLAVGVEFDLHCIPSHAQTRREHITNQASANGTHSLLEISRLGRDRRQSNWGSESGKGRGTWRDRRQDNLRIRNRGMYVVSRTSWPPEEKNPREYQIRSAHTSKPMPHRTKFNVYKVLADIK
ncbi:hypothetical protein FB451DRAFT_1529122 [Mycena latifolia]|nr:hypothetical protein FB451DRAFT_1529122 [Mycena latifolia]